jgi:putative selenium metabolism hydrolase
VTRELWERHRDGLVAFLREIVRIPSMPGEEGPAVERTLAEMERLGLSEVHADRAGNAVSALPGTGGGTPRLLLNAHLDVVSPGDPSRWTHPPYGGALEGDRIYGRGTMDTKGSVACQLYAAAALREAGAPLRCDVVVSAVVQEEIGGLGTVGLLEDSRPFDAAIVGEASGGALKIGHRGRTELHVVFRGRSAHAALAHEGRNPHFSAAAFLERLRELEMEDDPVVGAASVVPTRAFTDNESTNVIPETQTLILDWRHVPAETPEGLVSRVRELAEAVLEEGIEVSVEVPMRHLTSYTGYERDLPHVMPAYRIEREHPVARAAAGALEALRGAPPRIEPWGFATDGGHLSLAGVPVLGYGPGTEGLAHTVDEYVTLDELRDAFEAYVVLVRTIDAALSRDR